MTWLRFQKLTKKYAWDLRTWLALLLIAVGMFHPFPPTIRNAITQGLATGYKLQISLWRVLFEPFFGPLIFLMRSPEPLKLYLTFFFWALFFLLVRNGWRHRSISRGLLEWLKAVPLYLIVLIGLLWLVIFAPLPGDTVSNRNPDTILVNFHSHSYFSHDGLISWQGQQAWHAAQGFDAFFLTDHNHHQKTLEAVALQRSGRLPALPLILAGMEYSGSNHILLLGLQRSFNPKDYSDQAAIDSAHSQSGIALIAHWFVPGRRTRNLTAYIDSGADGFEIVNQAQGAFHAGSRAQPIIEACRSRGLLMVAGCDYHGYSHICQSWTALQIPGWHAMKVVDKQESILQLLRKKEQNKITVLVLQDRPAQLWPISVRPWQAAFSYLRTLNFYQILSWLFWSWLLIRPSVAKRWRQLAFPFYLCAVLFLLGVGLYLYGQSLSLKEYNDVLGEYGRTSIAAGILLLLYTLGYFKEKLKIFFAK